MMHLFKIMNVLAMNLKLRIKSSKLRKKLYKKIICAFMLVTFLIQSQFIIYH